MSFGMCPADVRTMSDVRKQALRESWAVALQSTLLRSPTACEKLQAGSWLPVDNLIAVLMPMTTSPDRQVLEEKGLHGRVHRVSTTRVSMAVENGPVQSDAAGLFLRIHLCEVLTPWVSQRSNPSLIHRRRSTSRRGSSQARLRAAKRCSSASAAMPFQQTCER